jgi:hypothetical protein
MFEDGIKWAAGGVLLAGLLLGVAACNSSSGNGSPEPTATPPGGGGGGEQTATIVPVTTPVPDPGAAPAAWKEYHRPADSSSDGFSFRYPPTWTLRAPSSGANGMVLSVVLASYNFMTSNVAAFPPNTTKVDIAVMPVKLITEPGFQYGCSAKDSPLLTEGGKQLRRAELQFADAADGEIARASVVELRTELFAYCIVAGYTSDVPLTDDTFAKIVGSLKVGQ